MNWKIERNGGLLTCGTLGIELEFAMGNPSYVDAVVDRRSDVKGEYIPPNWVVA